MRPSLLKQEGGSTSLEYAAAAFGFLLVVFGALEICSATYTYTVLADAANEGVHYAMLNSTDESGTVDMVKKYAKCTLRDTTRINVALSYPDGTTTPPSRVAINVSYDYVPYVRTFMTNPPTMHAFAMGRLVR